MSEQKLRDPDKIAEAEASGTVQFEDLTDRFALKLGSIMRMGGRASWELFQETFGIADLRARTGILPIAYRLEAEVTDQPLNLGMSSTTKTRVDLSHSGQGEDVRIISRLAITASAPAFGSGKSVPAGSCEVHHVFTKLMAPPPQRRVRSLEGLGFSKALPSRKVEYVSPQELQRPPEGYVPLGGVTGDGEPHVWPYGNTDPNQHVHMMDYVGFAMTFVTDQLARLGHSPDDYFFRKLRVIYRRPFFTGNFYHRRGQAYELKGADTPSLCYAGGYYRSEGAPPPDEQPSVAFQLFTAPKKRGGLLAGGGH